MFSNPNGKNSTCHANQEKLCENIHKLLTFLDWSLEPPAGEGSVCHLLSHRNFLLENIFPLGFALVLFDEKVEN